MFHRKTLHFTQLKRAEHGLRQLDPVQIQLLEIRHESQHIQWKVTNVHRHLGDIAGDPRPPRTNTLNVQVLKNHTRRRNQRLRIKVLIHRFDVQRKFQPKSRPQFGALVDEFAKLAARFTNREQIHEWKLEEYSLQNFRWKSQLLLGGRHPHRHLCFGHLSRFKIDGRILFQTGSNVQVRHSFTFFGSYSVVNCLRATDYRAQFCFVLVLFSPVLLSN
uniref:(northern house mosquito) hypothetical protein n=1 Tax=Culex pipiens TaxID=7175 RepID=A0A8D8H4I8_CULPI